MSCLVFGHPYLISYAALGCFLRSDYFKALFRKGGMKESEDGRVVIESCNVPTVRRMLEFIYTNRIEGLSSCCASEIIDLLGVADEYLMTVSSSFRNDRKYGETVAISMGYVSDKRCALCCFRT